MCLIISIFTPSASREGNYGLSDEVCVNTHIIRKELMYLHVCLSWNASFLPIMCEWNRRYLILLCRTYTSHCMQNAKLSVFATRPGIRSPVFNWIVVCFPTSAHFKHQIERYGKEKETALMQARSHSGLSEHSVHDVFCGYMAAMNLSKTYELLY